MSNLEDFLRQAAERRKQRERGSPSPGNQMPPLRDRPPNAYQPPVLRAEIIVEPEIIEPEIVDAVADRHLKNLQSTLPKKAHLAKEIDQADEKMVDRQKQVFDHRVGHLAKQKKPKAKTKTARISDNQPDAVVDTSPSPRLALLEMLRQPNSLRAAFIASEIFKRKHF